jgi:hypothetical protein
MGLLWLTFPNTLIRWSEGPDIPDWEVTNVFVSATGGVLVLLANTSIPNVAIWAESLAVLSDFKDQGPAAEMLANLVLGVCVDMTAHRPAPKRAPSAKALRAPARERQGAPPTADYVITSRAVHMADPGEDVDCTSVVRAYARTGKVPETQRLHRGHHQMQVHGPGLSLRRLQFHRPYWQGPIDGLVAVRPHVRGPRSDQE